MLCPVRMLSLRISGKAELGRLILPYLWGELLPSTEAIMMGPMHIPDMPVVLNSLLEV